MPSLIAAIPNSLLRNGVKNIATARSLEPRLINEHVSNFKDTISSWDKCMSQTYCRWPAIVALVVGLLIVLSIITCITRCLCCGYSCCCSCFSFLNCCGCKGCCDGKRYKSSGRMGQNSAALRNQGYVAPGAMMTGGINKPQYSQFPTNTTVNKPVNEDALPAMPSWDTATKVHVLDEEEEVNNVESKDTSSLAGPNVPLVRAGAATGMSSPSIQNSQEFFPHQSRPAPSINNGHRSPVDPYNHRTYQNMGISPSPSPTLNSEFGTRGNGVGYRGSPSNFIGDEYVPPVRTPNNQNTYPQPPLTPNRFGSPGPGRNLPGTPNNQNTYAQPPLTPNRFGSPGPGRNLPGRAYQTPLDQGPMIGYQGYRG